MSERLKHKLEVQATGIERVFVRHKIPASVQGGTVRPLWTSFDLQTQLTSGVNHLRELKRDLMKTLGVPEVRIVSGEGGLQVEIRNPAGPAVDLLDLMNNLPTVKAGVIVLGVAEDDRPVLLNLQADDTHHVCIVGDSTAGKTTLLRTIALSLALTHKQSQIQLVAIGPDQDEDGPRLKLTPLNYLPHMLSSVLSDLPAVAESLAFLAGEVAYRREQGVGSPRIVLLIDDLDSLFEDGGRPVQEPVQALVRKGAMVGIHCILALRNPQLAYDLWPAGQVIRLVGKMADGERAELATGRSDLHAQYLLGQGDFLAVSGDTALRFQVAFADDYAIHHSLNHLHRRHQPTMVAQPYWLRPHLSGSSDPAGTERPFTFPTMTIDPAPSLPPQANKTPKRKQK